jgi:monofunctional biosynthetic peptidoglycan transglycosylase
MIKKILKFLLKVCLWFLAIPIIAVVIFKWVPVPATPLMVIRSYEQWQEDKPVVWKHDWVSIDEISDYLELAVVCTEDQNFIKHNGFDMGAIEKALKHNEKSKRKRGASTISQQTAKNVFLWPGRSWVRKGLETYVTFLIELIWSKERIMEVYLNSIEMGDGIYGAEAASQRWFKKSAIKLNKSEAAGIAVILPNPRKYRANPATSYIAKRKAWTVRQMGFHGGKLNYDKPK